MQTDDYPGQVEAEGGKRKGIEIVCIALWANRLTGIMWYDIQFSCMSQWQTREKEKYSPECRGDARQGRGRRVQREVVE